MLLCNNVSVRWRRWGTSNAVVQGKSFLGFRWRILDVCVGRNRVRIEWASPRSEKIAFRCPKAAAGVTAIWLAVNGLTSKKWIRISSRVAAIVIVGVILALGGSWMAKANTPVATAVPPAPIQQPSPTPQEKPVKRQSALALHVTGYTLYQQTVGEPLRLGIHVANDGSTTIKSSGASAVGVFESNGNAPQPELEEKVFRVAKRKFEEFKNTGS